MAEFLRHTGHVDWHEEGQRIWGIPYPLGMLLDRVFETVPPAEASTFAVDATQAIPVGADLSQVTATFLLSLLSDEEHGVRRLTADGSVQRVAVDTVVGCYRRRLAGDEPDHDEWLDAADAIDDADYAAHVNAADRAARAARARRAAYYAYYATYYAAADAVNAADYAAAADTYAAYSADSAYAAAGTNHYRWRAAKLIDLLAT